MNKKEIYEHLANIYLDASSNNTKKKNKLKAFTKSIKSLIIGGFILILGIAGSFTYFNSSGHNQSSQTTLFLYQDSAKLNFNFDPAKKETFSLSLNQLDLSKYKKLGFFVRKTNPKDTISLRVEFINRFNEKSEYYVKDIPAKWTNQEIDFSSFTKLNDWRQMKSLSFSVEEWNAREKSGIVYIDNIRVLR